MTRLDRIAAPEASDAAAVVGVLAEANAGAGWPHVREALALAELRPPLVPVVANVTAEKATDPTEIRELLVRQVTGTVRWRECVATMAAEGCDRFVEIGAGKVLTGLMKRNAPEATALAIGTPADVEAFLKSL